MSFVDHFSGNSGQYARSRPSYPDALYAFVAGAAPSRALAWDCATGSGQAATGLARHFGRVEATDASAEQVRNAAPAANVRYSVQPAERTDFPDASFDAVCVAQALHWFDLERFYAEVRRVLRPGGVIAVWGYDWMRTARGFDALFTQGILGKLRSSWPAQNRILWDGYRTVAFPFERVEAPRFEMRLEWSFDQFRGYVGTWTGTRRYLADHGEHALDGDWVELEREWGGVATREFVVPLHVVCGRHG
jgi:ubiquinone/menaquinone biosynthesis C-methylase UbiE